MTGDELLSAVRREIKDDVQPYLWSDETIMHHLQTAEIEFCRETHVLIESDIRFDTIVGTSTYSLPNKVIHIYDVFVTEVDPVTSETSGMFLRPLAGRNLVPSFNSTGKPSSYSRSRGDKTVLLFPIPDAVYSIGVSAAVRPDPVLDYVTEPSIDEEDHYALVWYAAAQCLYTNDVDGSNVGTAEKFQGLWGRHIVKSKREEFRYRTGSRFKSNSFTGS